MTNLSPVAVNRLVEPDSDSSIVEFMRDDQVHDVESHLVQGRCTVDAGRYVEIKQLAVVQRSRFMFRYDQSLSWSNQIWRSDQFCAILWQTRVFFGKILITEQCYL